MKFSRVFSITILLIVSLSTTKISAQFVNFGKAEDFLEIDVHAQVGGSGVFQNYMKCFNQIQELNTTAGTAYGIGARAVFGISNFLGLGTELNLNLDCYNMDLAVNDNSISSVSNIFLHNRYLYAEIPVFVSFRFNASNTVRLNLDLGIYYQYGLGGNQKQSIYNTTLNELGQLVPQTVYIQPKYFDSRETFINSFSRSDIGLHFSPGLRFGKHINIAAKLGVGFKNISYTDGIVNPAIRNYTILGCVGYQF